MADMGPGLRTCNPIVFIARFAANHVILVQAGIHVSAGAALPEGDTVT
jgi:hypothetical protein